MNDKSAMPTVSDPAAGLPAADVAEKNRQSNQAIIAWCVFFALLVLVNGTIPFALGVDLRAWTASPIKSLLLGFIVYGVLFLVVPLVLIKGWDTVRKPAFLLPLILAVLGITFWHFFWPGVTAAIAVLAYLHWRFDLSAYGIRSRGLRTDLAAIVLMGILGLVPVLMRSSLPTVSVVNAAGAALARLFANPASSFENLFYFGFLTERLSYRTGRWLTPLLIGLMYTAHEMSNPEYWYGGMSFALTFAGVAIWAAIYLWRRSAVVIWLGDGLYRFVMALF